MLNEMRDYRDYQKRKLSGSVDGKGIVVAADSSLGTVIHTALGSVAANEWDEVFIQAVNTSASDGQADGRMGQDLFDITAFGDEVHKFSPGQRMMALQHAGFMNSAEASSHPVLQGAAVDGVFSLYLGQNAAPTVGDPVFSLLARQGRYGALPQVNRMIPFRAGFANRGEDGGWGIALTQPAGCDRDDVRDVRWTTAAPTMGAALPACMCWKRPQAMLTSSRLRVRLPWRLQRRGERPGDLRAGWPSAGLGAGRRLTGRCRAMCAGRRQLIRRRLSARASPFH